MNSTEVSEDQVPAKVVEKRVVGQAMNWLRTREAAIHADKVYLDAHPMHTVIPWGNRRILS